MYLPDNDPFWNVQSEIHVCCILEYNFAQRIVIGSSCISFGFETKISLTTMVNLV